MKLSDLRLRSSTLQLLQQRGFATAYEVERSRNEGGLSNLAAELGCTLSQTSDLWRELQGCIAMTVGSESSTAVPWQPNLEGRVRIVLAWSRGEANQSNQQQLNTVSNNSILFLSTCQK
jgi:hypothetical protein